MTAHTIAEYGGQLVEKFLYVALAGAHVSRAGLELGEVEDVVDEVEESVGARQDARRVLAAPVVVDVGTREELRKADDGVERRPQFVRHHCKEASLCHRVLFRHCRLAPEEPRHVRAVNRHYEKYHDEDSREYLQ